MRQAKTSKQRLPAWKKLVFAGSVFFVFIGILLAALEVTLHLKYPSAGFNGWRGGFRYTWGHKVVKNRYGYRERDFDVPKPEGVFRVMVLGDSCTFGQGLSEEEKYSRRLEALLRDSHPGERIEVFNFGVRGAPTTEERDILQAHVDTVDPDLVIVGFCVNDPQPKSQRYSVEGEKYEFLYRMTQRLRHFKLHRTTYFLDACLESLLENTGLVPRWQVALQRTYEPESKEWREFVKALRDIKAVSDDRGLPPPIFISLNQGTSPTRPTNYANPDEELKTYLKWYHQAENAAKEAGLVAVNVVEELAREMADEPMAVNPLDNHPSAKCNEIYAQKLRESVSPLIAARTLRPSSSIARTTAGRHRTRQ